MSAESSAEEHRKVCEWLKSSGQNREYFEHLRAVWILAAFPRERAKAADYEKFRSRFFLKAKKRYKYRYLSLIAAAASLLVVFFTVSLYIQRDSGFSGEDMVTLANNGDDLLYHWMPDGSRLTLFPGARIYYKKDFLQKRAVLLQGRAFFDIAKDASNPFHVYASDVDILVTGTKFLVIYDAVQEAGNALKVFLEEGKISARNMKGSGQINMLPGDVVVIGKDRQLQKISNAGIPEEMGIMANCFQFENVKMGKVLQQLASYYNVSFVCGNDTVGELLFTGEIKNKNIEECLDLFNRTMGLQYSVKDTVITLY